MPVKVREIVRELEEDGWVQVDQAGSHRHFEHLDKAGKVTVAGKPNASLKPKTEASIRGDAGLPKR